MMSAAPYSLIGPIFTTALTSLPRRWFCVSNRRSCYYWFISNAVTLKISRWSRVSLANQFPTRGLRLGWNFPPRIKDRKSKNNTASSSVPLTRQFNFWFIWNTWDDAAYMNARNTRFRLITCIGIGLRIPGEVGGIWA